MIFSRGSKKIHFVHIPKTGGTSVHELLREEGWQHIESPPLPEMCAPHDAITGDPDHPHWPLRAQWHPEWEYEFSLVRNPYDRILSQFYHTQRSGMDEVKEKAFEMSRSDDSIDPVRLYAAYLASMPFLARDSYKFSLAWASQMISHTIPAHGIGIDNNHFRPQYEFLGPNTRVFRLEDQQQEMLSELTKREYISKSASLSLTNVSAKKKDPIPWMMSPDSYSDFLSLYENDFLRFEYSTSMPAPTDDPEWQGFLKSEPDFVTGVKFSEEQNKLCKSGYQIMMAMYPSDITREWKSIPPPEVLEKLDQDYINAVSFKGVFINRRGR